jgi:acetyl esterase/lipase
LSNLGAPHPSITQYKLQIPVRDGWLSRSIVCRPSSPAAPGPVIVIYHGGGFWTGNPEGMLNYARRLSQSLDAVIVCPSYRLAPEDPFPIGVNDAWDVLVWLSSNASSINADLGKGFIVGGNSAGANFAGVLARRAVEENLQPPVTGQWISFPAFGHVGIEGVEQAIMVPEAERYQRIWGMSWSQNEDAMIVNQEYAAEILGWYNSDYTSPLYNPLTAKPPLDMGKMPKAFIQIAGGDLFRDDGIVYAYALGDAGVDVRLEAYSGVPHTFPFFLPMLEVSKKATVDTAMGFAWLLNIEIDEGVAVKSMQGNA